MLLSRVINSDSAIEKDCLEPQEIRRDAVLARLADDDREISEQDIATILDDFRHDGDVHRALIARERLPADIVERLIRLVGRDADLDDLLRRHAVAGSLPEGRRTVRTRPNWWQSGLLGGRGGS